MRDFLNKLLAVQPSKSVGPCHEKSIAPHNIQTHVETLATMLKREAGELIEWFADEGVRTTSESAINDQRFALSDLYRKGAEPLRHVELERMFHSLLCFGYFMTGNAAAFHGEGVVCSATRDAFTASSKRFIEFFGDPKTAIDDNMMLGVMFLLLSDVGKTPTALKRAAAYASSSDHDKWLGEVFQLPLETLVSLFPVLAKLPEPLQQELKTLVHISKQFHPGHIRHLEGGPQQLFGKFIETVQSPGEDIEPHLISRLILLQLADVSAAEGHGSLFKTPPFTATTAALYGCVESVLLRIAKKEISTINDAYDAYVNAVSTATGFQDAAAKYPSLNSEDKDLLIRLLSLIRWPDEAIVPMIQAYAALSDTDKNALRTSFGRSSGFNTWKVNPTYLPPELIGPRDNPYSMDKVLHVALNFAQYTIANHDKHAGNADALNCSKIHDKLLPLDEPAADSGGGAALAQ